MCHHLFSLLIHVSYLAMFACASIVIYIYIVYLRNQVQMIIGGYVLLQMTLSFCLQDLNRSKKPQMQHFVSTLLGLCQVCHIYPHCHISTNIIYTYYISMPVCILCIDIDTCIYIHVYMYIYIYIQLHYINTMQQQHTLGSLQHHAALVVTGRMQQRTSMLCTGTLRWSIVYSL